MVDLLQQIADNPLASLLVIGNLIVIESLLSVDNAAVLATMVMDLPVKQRAAALKYGIIGAYLFRGLCLFLPLFYSRSGGLNQLEACTCFILYGDGLREKRHARKMMIISTSRVTLFTD